MPEQHARQLSGIAPRLLWLTIAGGAAGALTATGVKIGDRLLAVVNVAAAGANLVDEFTITAADTIDNTGGTNTTGMILLVVASIAPQNVT